MDSTDPKHFFFSKCYDPEAMLPTQFSQKSDKFLSRQDSARDECLVLSSGAGSTVGNTQSNVSSEHKNFSPMPLQMFVSSPYVLEDFTPQATNAGKTQRATNNAKTEGPANTNKPQEVVSINLCASIIDATQSTPEQSRPQSDSLIGSVMRPIVLDDTGDQESSAEVYPSPSGSSIAIATQSGHRSNGLVGSATNPIVLDDTNDQESSVEVYPSLSGSTTSSSFCLKRKRSISDDCNPNQDKMTTRSHFVGSRGYSIRPNPERAVRPSHVNQGTIQKLLKNPDMVIWEDSNIGYEYGEEVRRQQRLRRLHARRDKLIEEMKDIWSEIDSLEGEH